MYLMKPKVKKLTVDQKTIEYFLDRDVAEKIPKHMAERIAPTVVKIKSDERYKQSLDEFELTNEERDIIYIAGIDFDRNLNKMYDAYKKRAITGRTESGGILKWDTRDNIVITLAIIQQLMQYQKMHEIDFAESVPELV